MTTRPHDGGSNGAPEGGFQRRPSLRAVGISQEKLPGLCSACSAHNVVAWLRVLACGTSEISGAERAHRACVRARGCLCCHWPAKRMYGLEMGNYSIVRKRRLVSQCHPLPAQIPSEAGAVIFARLCGLSRDWLASFCPAFPPPARPVSTVA